MTVPLLAFKTLAEVGYTSCQHPRMKINTEGRLDAPLRWCMDCGATWSADGPMHPGTMTYPRYPWTL